MTVEETVHRIKFLANPSQRAFIKSRARAVMFSSRVGEGKSAGLAWAAWDYTQQNPGAIVALVRGTWENLRATTQREFFYWFKPGVFGSYSATQKIFKWTAQGLKGEIQFIGMDDPDDAEKLASRAFGLVLIDEAAPYGGNAGISEEIFDAALGRLRLAGMKWYSVKLAENNPDESHWTYRRFVDPGDPRFEIIQPREPENVRNLPQNYYQDLEKDWAHRPDFIRRFIGGKFGFQKLGKDVTPNWNDDLHLARNLKPIKGRELILGWDFGQNATCIVTQITPLRHWNILEAHVMQEGGVYELIEMIIKPILNQDYEGFMWRHIGDPSGSAPEQSSRKTSAVKVIQRELGGPWQPGAVSLADRIDPLNRILQETIGGLGLVQVDRDRAKPVWHALRGGWHRPVHRGGVVGQQPVKNIHSHPGEATGYMAGRLFPLGKLRERGRKVKPRSATFFSTPGVRVPKEARIIG